VLLYEVFSLADLDYVAWPLKTTSAVLNLRVGQQLNHRPDVEKSEASV
jgi:hypothetical protein